MAAVQHKDNSSDERLNVQIYTCGQQSIAEESQCLDPQAERRCFGYVEPDKSQIARDEQTIQRERTLFRRTNPVAEALAHKKRLANKPNEDSAQHIPGEIV